jgi:uncharacterized protein
MIIKIAGLSEGLHEYKFEEPVENLGLEEGFTGNLTAEVELNKVHNQIVLNVSVNVTARFECDRCNRTFDQELNPYYQIVYLFGDEPDDNEDINIIYLSPDADKINIAPEVRDYVLLSVPMKKLCAEECKGLCPKCGKDLNQDTCECESGEVDSRWLPLQELKKKLNNN